MVEEHLEDGCLAQPLEPLPQAVPFAKRFGSARQVMMQRFQKQPIVTALGAASRQRRAEHRNRHLQSSSVIVVDMPTLQISRQSMNHIESQRGTLNHVPK